MDLNDFLVVRLDDSAVMTDIMVDCETTGTDPAHNAMIQLAGIKFNYHTQEIGESFNMSLAMPYGRFWDQQTKEWWGQQNQATFKKIIENMQDPQMVMEHFWRYATRDVPVRDGEFPGGLRFWAKPLTFDWGFVASYMRQYGLQMPFHYRIARDMNTHIAALKGGVDHVNMDHITLKGDAHNALYDCALQLRQLFAAKRGEFEQVEVEAA